MFKRRHNAVVQDAPAIAVIDTRAADKERFANAKRRMVRELWEMGFPRAEIVSAVGFYSDGRGEALERALSAERHNEPVYLLYNYAAADPFHGCHAFAKWQLHQMNTQDHSKLSGYYRWFAHPLDTDDWTSGRAHHLRRWGIPEEEIIKWANETRRRNEDRELARALEK